MKPQQAIEQYRRFLELQSKNEKMRTEAMRRLGDLQVEVDEAARAAGVDVRRRGPGAERSDHSSTKGCLKSHPDYARNDAVMYQLSRAHEAQAKPEKALAVLDQLVAKYPQSPWYTEAQFRRGEILFSAGRYRDAELAYNAVVKAGPDSDFYEQGLYKHGWSLFKQSRGEESVASFLKVLDRVLIRDGKLRERDSLTRPERELSDDTLRVMAITFSDLDGPETLDALLKQRGAIRSTHTCCTKASAISTSARSASRTRRWPSRRSRSAARTTATRRRCRCARSRRTRRAASHRWCSKASRRSSSATRSARRSGRRARSRMRLKSPRS